MLRLCNSENTNEDFELLWIKCSYYTIEHNSWIEKGFEDNNIMNIFSRNKDILSHNNRKIFSTDNPIALVKSENTR